MLELNKRCKWSDIVEHYPDKWVFITDIKYDKNGNILECKLLEVCKHEENHIYLKKYMKQGIDFEYMRTTFSAPTAGVLF